MYTPLQRDATRPPVTLATLARMKADGEKIASLTCYDASFAVLLDAADVDVVLVGDSLGNPDRKSTRLNSSHLVISYAVFCLKKKKKTIRNNIVWSTD